MPPTPRVPVLPSGPQSDDLQPDARLLPHLTMLEWPRAGTGHPRQSNDITQHGACGRCASAAACCFHFRRFWKSSSAP